MKLLWAASVWEYCSALWCALRCWIFLIFHIVEHPDDFQYRTIPNILSAQRRSQLFSSPSFTRSFCVCRLTSQPTNFHSLNFCSFSIQLFFFRIFSAKPNALNTLFRISASVEVKCDVLWWSKGVAKRKSFHESVYYLGELEVLHTISSSIFTFFVLLLFFPRSHFSQYTLHFICKREDKMMAKETKDWFASAMVGLFDVLLRPR